MLVIGFGAYVATQTWLRPMATEAIVREVRLVYGDGVRVPREIVDGPQMAVAAFDAMGLRNETVECFAALYLDRKHRPIGYSIIHRGKLAECAVEPAAVLAPALRLRAAAIVVGHNHPSGDCTPSEDDRLITRKLAAAAGLMGVTLLDSIVVGETEVVSTMHNSKENS